MCTYRKSASIRRAVYNPWRIWGRQILTFKSLEHRIFRKISRVGNCLICRQEAKAFSRQILSRNAFSIIPVLQNHAESIRGFCKYVSNTVLQNRKTICLQRALVRRPRIKLPNFAPRERRKLRHTFTRTFTSSDYNYRTSRFIVRGIKPIPQLKGFICMRFIFRLVEKMVDWYWDCMSWKGIDWL